MKALVSAEAVAAADVNLAWQPAGAPSLGIPGGHCRAVQSLAGKMPCLHQVRQMQEGGNDGLVVAAEQPIKLAPKG